MAQRAARTRCTIVTTRALHRSDDGALGAVAPVTPAADATYQGAFARVRLVRAWIGAAAAMVALGYAFAALLDRLLS